MGLHHNLLELVPADVRVWHYDHFMFCKRLRILHENSDDGISAYFTDTYLRWVAPRNKLCERDKEEVVSG